MKTQHLRSQAEKKVGGIRSEKAMRNKLQLKQLLTSYSNQKYFKMKLNQMQPKIK